MDFIKLMEEAYIGIDKENTKYCDSLKKGTVNEECKFIQRSDGSIFTPEGSLVDKKEASAFQARIELGLYVPMGSI